MKQYKVCDMINNADTEAAERGITNLSSSCTLQHITANEFQSVQCGPRKLGDRRMEVVASS